MSQNSNTTPDCPCPSHARFARGSGRIDDTRRRQQRATSNQPRRTMIDAKRTTANCAGGLSEVLSDTFVRRLR
jgi:hypothetical protein